MFCRAFVGLARNTLVDWLDSPTPPEGRDPMFCRDRAYLICCLTVFLFVTGHLAFGQADSRFNAEDEPEPMPAWALPLKGGPIRVAAVFPNDALADFTALEGQIEIRLAVHPFGEADSFDGAVAAGLKGKPDVLIAAAGGLSDLAAETRTALEEHLTRGGGLLWIGFAPATTPELPAFVEPLGLSPADPAPDFVTRAGGQALTGLQPGYDAFAAYRGETARAVELRFWSTRPYGHALLPLTPQDTLRAPETMGNYLAIVCHALGWVAGRDAPARFLAVQEIAPSGPSATETPPQLPGRFIQRMQQAAIPGALRQFSVSLDRPAPRNYDLRVQLRYPGRGVSNAFAALDEFPKGAEQIVFTVPAGSGDAFLDVWLIDGVDVVDWFTQPLHLSTTPEFTELSFSTVAVDANDRLRVTAKVEGRLQSAQPRVAASQTPIAVFLRITDPLGREVTQRDFKLPAAGGELNVELPLIDLLGPYARADLFASFASESALDWWTRARADYRAVDLLVRQPWPEGLALIADDPGEGSFAGSARRRALLNEGVDFIAPGAFPALGNIAADGLRPIADLGSLDQFPGEDFGPRTPSGIALRQAAAPFAAIQPGLYTITNGSNRPYDQMEALRRAMERAIRESDPRAALAVLSDGLSAPQSGGFRVVPLKLLQQHPAAYEAVRTSLPAGEHGQVYGRWLPWYAAAHRVNALWINESATTADAFAALTAEARRVREGFDTLFQRATPESTIDEGSVDIPSDFPGVVRAYTLDKATIYAFLADPDGNGKSVAKLKAEGDARLHELTTAEMPHAVKRLAIKLRPGEVAVVAILPYEVSRIVIDAPAAVPAGRRLTVRASVKTKGALPGDHVLRMTIQGPASKRLDHYSRTIIAPEGEGVAWIPLAYNDTPGKYRVSVRDLFTGIESSAEISVVVPQEGGLAGSR